MKENAENRVHLYGLANRVSTRGLENGKTAVNVDVATYESYKGKDDAGKDVRKNRSTYHRVNIVTDNEEMLAKLNAIAADCAENAKHRVKGAGYEEGYKPVLHGVSIDGVLASRSYTGKDGIVRESQVIVASPEDVMLDVKKNKEDKEQRNSADIKGNIAKCEIINDKFAKLRVATHFFVPGESVNHKGEKVPYTEKTSFVDVRINRAHREAMVADLKSGKLGVGDLVNVHGILHNDNYTDKDGVERFKIVLDASKIELVAKKGQKEEAKAEQKAEPEKKVTKKAKKAVTPKVM